MTNGRLWSQDELAQINTMLEPGGYLQRLARRLDRTPEAILIKAHKVLKAASENELSDPQTGHDFRVVGRDPAPLIGHPRHYEGPVDQLHAPLSTA